MHLKNVLLVVKDIYISTEFYKRYFGLQVLRDFGTNVILSEGLVLQERETWMKEMGLECTTIVDTTERGSGISSELYFEDTNLEAFHKLVTEDMIVTPLYVNMAGQKVLRVSDPDGHFIEIREV